MHLRVLLVLMSSFSLTNGHGLSAAEVAMFSNSGTYGGNVTVVTSGSNYIIYANGLPDHAMQQVNPNTATAQNIEITIKQSPTVRTTNVNCIPMGMIGLTKHGVAVYNLLTSTYKNAVEGSDAETFDNCDGHPTNMGSYHYHKLPQNCVYNGNTDEFLGVAIDGIPIYGPKVSWQTSLVTSADLDICNGKTMSNGEYRYFVTSDWPYFMGCLKGEIIDTEFQSSLNRVTCSTTTSVFQNVGCPYLCPCESLTTSQVTGVFCDASRFTFGWIQTLVLACIVNLTCWLRS